MICARLTRWVSDNVPNFPSTEPFLLWSPVLLEISTRSKITHRKKGGKKRDQTQYITVWSISFHERVLKLWVAVWIYSHFSFCFERPLEWGMEFAPWFCVDFPHGFSSAVSCATLLWIEPCVWIGLKAYSHWRRIDDETNWTIALFPMGQLAQQVQVAGRFAFRMRCELVFAFSFRRVRLLRSSCNKIRTATGRAWNSLRMENWSSSQQTAKWSGWSTHFREHLCTRSWWDCSKLECQTVWEKNDLKQD